MRTIKATMKSYSLEDEWIGEHEQIRSDFKKNRHHELSSVRLYQDPDQRGTPRPTTATPLTSINRTEDLYPIPLGCVNRLVLCFLHLHPQWLNTNLVVHSQSAKRGVVNKISCMSVTVIMIGF